MYPNLDIYTFTSCKHQNWTPRITNRVPTHKQIPILIPLFIASRIPFSVNMEHGWDQFSTLTYGIRNISLVPIFSLFKLDEEI